MIKNVFKVGIIIFCVVAFSLIINIEKISCVCKKDFVVFASKKECIFSLNKNECKIYKNENKNESIEGVKNQNNKIQNYQRIENKSTQNHNNANSVNLENEIDTNTILFFEIVVDNQKFVFDEKSLLNQYKTNNLNKSLGKYKDYFQGLELAKKIKKMGFDAKTILNYLFANFDLEIEKIINAANFQPIDAKIEFYNNKPKVKNEVVGKKIEKDVIYNQIFVAFLNSNNVKISLNTQEVQPLIFGEDLKKFTAKRSEFTTYITGNNQEGRKHNIAVALSKFDKMRVEAGKTVSFNQIIGDTISENGYALAKVIVSGKFVEGYGGGVCQASTTLYNALLLAGIDIVEANPHSLRVGYVEPSFDAMVSYGLSDLIFKNNSGGPIYISTYASDTQCSVFIYGEEKNYTIKKRTEILDKDDNTPSNVNIKSRGVLEYYQNGDLIKTKPLRKDTYYFPKTE